MRTHVSSVCGRTDAGDQDGLDRIRSIRNASHDQGKRNLPTLALTSARQLAVASPAMASHVPATTSSSESRQVVAASDRASPISLPVMALVIAVALTAVRQQIVATAARREVGQRLP